MIKNTWLFVLVVVGAVAVISSCRTTKKVINGIIAQKDTVVVSRIDTLNTQPNGIATETINKLQANYIDFKTFSAKIKVESQDSKGKNPDITAVLRMVKDSAIWISLSATFLNVEVFRLYVTPDSVVLLDKREKTVQYRGLDYLQEVTQIPLDFKTLQDLLIGNPIFFNGNTATYRSSETYILANDAGSYFKTLLTLNPADASLIHIKLDDVDVSRSRTADITFDGYNKYGEINFATKRDITIVEKSKMQIDMDFKQFEFNKELSVDFNVPKNYQVKY